MVKFLFPWLQQEEGKTPRMFFNLIKDEYHLELIIYCICLYVVEGMCCNGSKMPENSFFISGYPTHHFKHGMVSFLIARRWVRPQTL